MTIRTFRVRAKSNCSQKGRYGIIDEHGKLVLPLTYDLIKRPSRYSDYANIFVATKGNKITILNEHANAIPAEGIVSYRYGNADLLVSDIHNKKGRVNYNGQLTIPFEYDTLFHFNDTTIIATKGNRYGLIQEKIK